MLFNKIFINRDSIIRNNCLLHKKCKNIVMYIVISRLHTEIKIILQIIGHKSVNLNKNILTCVICKNYINYNGTLIFNLIIVYKKSFKQYLVSIFVYYAQ